MRRPNNVIAPLSHPTSSASNQSNHERVRSSTRLISNSSSSPSLQAVVSNGTWTLPPLNQFMTLPRNFLASHFNTSMTTIYSTRGSNNRSNSTTTTSSSNRTIVNPLITNGSGLDNLLNDEDEEWNASDHFVLPHMMHYQRRNEVLETAEEAAAAAEEAEAEEVTSPQEEIDLTVSSSSEDEDYEPNAIGDSDDVIEIIEPLQTLVNASQPTSLRRKRRRSGVTASENVVLEPKRQHAMDMMQSVESTDVGMRNSEMLQKFKNELKCTICLDVMDDITSTICGHIFCAGCIRQAIRANGKCPLCQRRLHLKDIHPLFF